MKNTIRCCISCILPCGALDVVRIVHANGHVEEISSSIRASEILKAYPKHVLKKPISPSELLSSSEICPRIVIVSPESELRRGKIYFLMPAAPASGSSQKGRRSRPSIKKKNAEVQRNISREDSDTNFEVSDRYLREVLSENVSTKRNGRRGRSGVWRPHLQSICESLGDV